MESYESATSAVLKFIKKGARLPDDDQPVILEKETISLPWGWVFFYNGQRYVDTGDPALAWIGNVPLMYDKIKQSIEFIWEAGTRIEDNIREYGIKNGYIDDENTKHTNIQ